MIQAVIQAHNRKQLVCVHQVLDRLLRAGYYQIPTYGKGENWYAYWNMYRQPAIKPKLSAGIDYWWSDAAPSQESCSLFTSTITILRVKHDSVWIKQNIAKR